MSSVEIIKESNDVETGKIVLSSSAAEELKSFETQRSIVNGNGFVTVPTKDDFHPEVIRKYKDISWASVQFKVKDKIILSDCWGEVVSEILFASEGFLLFKLDRPRVGRYVRLWDRQVRFHLIMQPTQYLELIVGAGKSSLLNVLAGRSSSSGVVHVEGKIKVGGHLVNPVTYRKNIAYVMQDDFLMTTATPREALYFSAKLRLPANFTSEEIIPKVESLIKALGIEECADTITGGVMIKGISGGQRKRTSVGIELITDPTLLFLDEPTTGLDSFSALNLVKLLKQLASHCAILLTIHQPSSQMFYLFDVVIYMKEGRIFYQGSPNEILQYYELKGYHCPENFNPSDFVMDLCQAETGKQLEGKGLFMKIPDRYGSSFATEQTSVKFREDDLNFHFESSFYTQVVQLTYRESVHTLRDVHTLLVKFMLTIVMMLLYGLIFYQIGTTDNANFDELNSHFGALVIIMIFGMMGGAQSVLLSFPYERPMVLREYVTGTYGIASYFISKVSLELPIVFIQMLIAYILAYFLMGLQGNFIYLVLITWGLGMSSCSIAMGLGCLVPNVKNVSELVPLAYIPQMLFAGFFVRTGQIPVFLRWAQYLCGLKYAIDLALLTEFDITSRSCNTSPEARVNCVNLLDSNDVEQSDSWVYILLLVALFVVFRILGGIILYYKAKKFY